MDNLGVEVWVLRNRVFKRTVRGHRPREVRRDFLRLREFSGAFLLADLIHEGSGYALVFVSVDLEIALPQGWGFTRWSWLPGARTDLSPVLAQRL